MFPTTTKFVDDLEPGDHFYSAFRSTEEQEYLLARFVTDGLRRGERVLYFSESRAVDDVRAGLQRHGVDVDGQAARGALGLQPAAAGYLPGGRFDPERTRAGWHAARSATAADGFAGLRVGADMAWLARGLTGVEVLCRYERDIAEIFAGGAIIGMCEFDRRLFDRTTLDAMHDAHDGRRVAPPPLVRTTGMRAVLTFAPFGVALSGRLDGAVRFAVEDALRAAIAMCETDVLVDVTDATLLDLRGLGAIVRAVRWCKPGTCLVLRGVPMATQRMMRLVGWGVVSGLVLEPPPPARKTTTD